MNLEYSALQQVLRYDYRHHVLANKSNRSRFYLYLLPNGNDLHIHTIACRAPTRWRSVEAKEVIRASVDASTMYVKDIAYCGMAGYQVDWSPEGGRRRDWSYKGQWQRVDYAPRCAWKVWGTVVNPETLQSHPRFRYCAWTPACGHLLDWLKAYTEHPHIEMLAKSGVGWLGTRTSFVKQMHRNKSLVRWFMGHVQEIRDERYPVPAILRAFRTGVGISDAERSLRNQRVCRSFGIPKTLNPDRVMAYSLKVPVSMHFYAQYLRNCEKLGLDMTDTKTVCPHDLPKRSQIVADRVAEITRREQAEKAREQDTQIAAFAAQYARLEKRRTASMIIRIPRRTLDFVREGKRLANCLGDGHYAAKMARGETLLAFVRKSSRPDAAFVAVEWSPNQGRVLQCYAAKNQRPPSDVMRFVDRVFKAS